MREKGGDTKEKLKPKGTKQMDRAGIAGSPSVRSGSVVLVLLHMFFQDILRVIYVITIITPNLFVLKALIIQSLLWSHLLTQHRVMGYDQVGHIPASEEVPCMETDFNFQYHL